MIVNYEITHDALFGAREIKVNSMHIPKGFRVIKIGELIRCVISYDIDTKEVFSRNTYNSVVQHSMVFKAHLRGKPFEAGEYENIVNKLSSYAFSPFEQKSGENYPMPTTVGSFFSVVCKHELKANADDVLKSPSHFLFGQSCAREADKKAKEIKSKLQVQYE